MKKKIPLYVLIIIVATWIFCVIPRPVEKYSLSVDDKKIPLVIADTPELQEAGLSNRASLAPNSAMLFVFDKPDKYGFWMKDMKFNIDIIWLDKDAKVVHVEKNLSPDSYPDTFIPPEDSQYVLEVNAGFADKIGVTVGKKLNLIKR